MGLVVAPSATDAPEAERAPIRWVLVRRLLRYMWRYPRVQWLIVFQALVLSVLYTAAPILIAETIRWTIERPEQWRSATGTEPMAGLAIGAVLVAALGVFYFFLQGWRIRTVNRVSEGVVFDLRHEVFEHVQRLHMGYFDRTKLGRILSRATGDVTAVRSAVAQIIPRTLVHGVQMVIVLAVLLVYDWVLALSILALGPALWLLNEFFRERMTHAYRVVQESFSRLTSSIAESVSGVRVTQAFVRESVNDRLFADLCAEHRANNMRAAKIHGLYIPVFDLFSQCAAVLILLVGAWRLSHGHMGIADLVGFLLCSAMFFNALVIMADLYGTVLAAMAGAERIFTLLDTPPEVVNRADAQALPRLATGAKVELRDLTFAYNPAGPDVLHGVSLVVPPGTTTALVGHTGSGKTSIVGLVARLYETDRGQVLIDDRDVRDITLESLHDQIGLVLQDNFLFDGTALDNIRFGRPDASDDQVRQACSALDCLDVLERLPQGLHTPVGERGSALSLGQRQLVCFARAMLADPRILMLDEATSAVDTFTEHRIQTALERLMIGRTCIVVAHRLSTVRRAHQIVVLDHGRVIERGRHEQLLAAQGAYANLYREFIRLSDE